MANNHIFFILNQIVIAWFSYKLRHVLVLKKYRFFSPFFDLSPAVPILENSLKKLLNPGE